MTIDDILQTINVRPTIMTACEELDIIDRIAVIPDEELIAKPSAFNFILDRMYESHTGGAIFEVNSNNLGLFKAFASRLYILAEKATSPVDTEALRSIADVFDIEFPKDYK